jgi:nucleoside-triphosphatase THEP1
MFDMQKIFIVTGETRSGKTLLISRVISEINLRKVKVSGVFSPARFEGELKTGIYLVDISSQEKRLLANYKPGWDAENPKREWMMNPEVLQWGNTIIRDSLPTSVLIIDELGFLEFEKNQGWVSAFKILDEGEYNIAIIVVRIGLLRQALNKWKSAEIIFMDSESQCDDYVDYLMVQILAAIAK